MEHFGETKVFQCYGQLGRPKGPVAPDVYTSQKNNECHSIRLKSPLEKLNCTAAVRPRPPCSGRGPEL
jgi:hypothetical protein